MLRTVTGTGWAIATATGAAYVVIIACLVMLGRKIMPAGGTKRPSDTPVASDANAELLRELVRATFLDVHRGPELGPVAHTDPAATLARLQGGISGDWRDPYAGPDLLGVSNDMSDPMDQAIPPNVRPDAVMVEPGTAEYPWEKT